MCDLSRMNEYIVVNPERINMQNENCLLVCLSAFWLFEKLDLSDFGKSFLHDSRDQTYRCSRQWGG